MSYIKNGISIIVGLLFGTVLYSILNLIPNQSFISLIIELIVLFALTGFVTTYILPKTSSEDSQNSNALMGGFAGVILGFALFFLAGSGGSEFSLALSNVVAAFVFFIVLVVGGLIIGIVGGTFGVMVKNRN